MKQRLINASKIIWGVLLVVAISVYISKNTEAIRQQLLQLSFWPTAAACISLLAGKLFLAASARWSIFEIGRRVSLTHMYYMYSVADLAKYLPGGVWGIVGRLGIYSLRGLSIGESTRSFALEHVWLIGSAFFTGVLLCLPFLNGLVAGWLGWGPISTSWPILALEILVVCMAWGVALHIGTTIVKQERASLRLLLSVMVVQTGAAFALGISLWALFAPQVGYEHLFLTVAAFSLARGFGYIAFFAPAGIGVREAVIVTILSSVMPVDDAIFWAGVNRILFLLCELSIFPLVYLLYRVVDKDGAPLERINRGSLLTEETPRR